MTGPTKTKGCSTIVIFVVLGVLVLLAIPVLLFGMFIRNRASTSEKRSFQAELAHSQMSVPQSTNDLHEIQFKQGFRPRGIADIGDELSRESFVEFTIDSNATTLGREAFIKQANGRKVRWLMRVSDIKAASDGVLIGNFELPYRIYSGNGYSGSAVSIQASFPGSEEEALTRLCRYDWVTIEGQLILKDGYAHSLLEAKVVQAGK